MTPRSKTLRSGLIAIAIFSVTAAALLHAARWQEMPASSRRSFTFYGKCERGAKGTIMTPPKFLRLVIAPEEDNNCDGYGIVSVDTAELSNQKDFKMRMVNGDLVVDSLSFAVESDDVKGWGGEGFQKEGTPAGLKITYFIDDIPDLIKGQYILKENTVERHYYLVSKAWPMFVLVGMVILVVLIAAAQLIAYVFKHVGVAVKNYRRARE